MTEAEIAAQLKQKVAPAEEFTPAPKAPQDTSYGQATEAQGFELDEITQYKLHDLFGERYKPTDEVNRQRLSYIYEEVSKMVERPEYGYVAAKINDLQRMIGINQSDNRLYRLYQWLKLNNVRRNLDEEMASLTQ